MTLPSITALPTTPNRNNQATFSDDADAFLGALPIYRTELMAFGDAVEAAAQATNYNATSTTSLTIGAGSKSLTIETGKLYSIGNFVVIASTANPANYMYGQVTAHNATTGALTVNVISVGGSGTIAAWSISLTIILTGPLAVNQGGSGQTSYTNGQLLIGNTTGNTLTKATLTSGGGVTVTNGAGSITIAATPQAFAVYRGTNQTISDITSTKVQFATEELDTDGTYDSATNYRFTPTVAGWYQINASVSLSAASLVYGQASIYKNGSVAKRGLSLGVAMSAVASVISSLIYLNGSTDYVEIYAYGDATGSITVEGGANLTYFNGYLVRAG